VEKARIYGETYILITTRMLPTLIKNTTGLTKAEVMAAIKK
jgi:hypothetical protein